MKITQMIFDYWKIWMRVPEETNVFGSYNEGLSYYDGEWMTSRLLVSGSINDFLFLYSPPVAAYPLIRRLWRLIRAALIRRLWRLTSHSHEE